jgi:hypothetical protein
MAVTESQPRIPKPADPHRRQEPLPGDRPKPPSEDADAPAKLERILSSPSYRRIDEDIAFLDADETRGVRLQLDYMKPQLLLDRHGIEHTIAVFGSTRIVEPAAAEQRWRASGGRSLACPTTRICRRDSPGPNASPP